MTQRQRLLDTVERDLHLDGGHYICLSMLMQELYQQLLRRDSEQIERLNGQIGELLEQLQLSARRRTKILAAFGTTYDAAAMRRLLALFPGQRGTALQANWQQLGRLAEQCKRLNERNGKLLAMHHEVLEQLLGQPEDRLYGPLAY
jgi:flagella synthesis protein FlgN